MSIDAVGWALSHDNLSPMAKMVLIVLAESANIHRNHVCDYHDQETLAKRASVSIDTFQRRIKDLSEAGLIHVVNRRAPDGSKAKNYYVGPVDADAKTHAMAHGWTPRKASQMEENRSDKRTGFGDHTAGCGMDHTAGETQPYRTENVAIPHCCGIEETGIDLNRPSPYPPRGNLGREALRGSKNRTGERRREASGGNGFSDHGLGPSGIFLKRRAVSSCGSAMKIKQGPWSSARNMSRAANSIRRSSLTLNRGSISRGGRRSRDAASRASPQSRARRSSCWKTRGRRRRGCATSRPSTAAYR